MARRRGFSLLEMAVGIAVMAILAGTMAPLAVKALDRHREAATRESLRLAFEALFGSRDHRVANLRADFGFDPKESHKTLPFLVANCWSAHVPAFGLHEGAVFPWGWNGPYWQGPVHGKVPVDAWGSPIDLVYAHGGWQVHSPGRDRQKGADDLYYPPFPATESSYQATVLVVITRESEDIGGTLALRYGGNAEGALASSKVLTIEAKGSPQSFSFQAPAGGMQLEFTPTTGGFKAFAVPMDLLPGQTRDVEVRL